jgi:ABC-type transport system involved in multi-copper enzyme maturation permease subunit
MRLGVMLSNEWIKARSRPAARGPVLGFALMMLLFFGGGYYMAIRHDKPTMAFPQAWAEILSEMPPVANFFLAVALMLVISSEFTWRTARQNVIDGLSREEWFTSKLILLPIGVMIFFLLQVTFGGLFALFGTDLGNLDGPLVSAIDLASMGGFILGMLGVASVAFMLAFLTRNSGSAIAFFLVYFTFGEALLALLLRRVEALAPTIRYLPATVFMRLQERVAFDPAVMERMIKAALEAGRPAPTPPSTTLLVVMACAYTALFVGIAFYAFKKRDL